MRGVRRRRRKAEGGWSSWEWVETPCVELRRGGTLSVFRDFANSDYRCEILREIDSSGDNFFRQYKCGNVPEPRLHVLLAKQPSVYRYHGVTMVAKLLEGKLAEMASRSSKQFGDCSWNAGVDVVCYRDGNDSCGWHADDTQGETLVFCVVLQSKGKPRKVCFRPKSSSCSPSRRKRRRRLLSDFEEGAEELELWLDEGDAYSMDGDVQVGYEHCVPKLAEDSGRRIVAIMRAGTLFRDENKTKDSGESVTSLAPREKRRVTFGALGCDSSTLYSREALMANGGHSSAQRGVAGSAALGAVSIVVSRQSSQLREADGLSWLRYTSTRRQGAAALWRSLQDKHLVRVFRSSSLLSPWAPKKIEPRLCEHDESRKSTDAAAVYRYDGLYRVVAMWDSAGAPSAVEPPQPTANDYDDPAYTFRLVRCDGPPNTCGNVEFANGLSSGICLLTPDSAVTLQPLSRDETSSRTRELFLLERRTVAASILLDVVSVVVAHQSGWFNLSAAPPLAQFGRWHAHRKLFWRFERFSRRSRLGPFLCQRTYAASPESNGEALLETTTKDEKLRAMLAAATARSTVNDAAARHLPKKDADQIVADDDTRLSSLSLENRCDLCGGDETDENDALLTICRSADDKVVRVHRHCALTSSEVYCDDDEGYVDVVCAVQRGRHMKCSREKKCLAKKRSGATVGCGNARCRKTYHYKCAIATGWHFLGPNLRFWCEAHREQAEVHSTEESWLFDCERCGIKGRNFDDGEDMWQCSQCESWQHARCAATFFRQSENQTEVDPDFEDDAENYRCSRCCSSQ